jgi:hypothetical protein
MRLFSGSFDQRHQPRDRILPVPLLGAEALGLDDEDTSRRHPPARQPDESFFDLLLKKPRTTDVEAQPNRRRNLVDVLSAWSRRTKELEPKLPRNRVHVNIPSPMFSLTRT